MSQNTKQYATIEQALEMVREYMKEKEIEEGFSGFTSSQLASFGDEFVDYYLRVESNEIVMFHCQSVELSNQLIWDIPIPESKEDFLTLMGILDV